MGTTFSRMAKGMAPSGTGTFKPNRFGKRTPFLLRVLVLSGYAEMMRRGIFSFYKILKKRSLKAEKYDPDILSSTLDGINVWLATYMLDTSIAIFPGWISMHGVDFNHMYEHHIPGLLFTILIRYQWNQVTQGDKDGNSNTKSWFAKLIETCPGLGTTLHFVVAMALMAHACESYFVFRTFLRDPNKWIHRVVQRMLGVTCMSSLSVTVILHMVAMLQAKSGFTLKVGELLYLLAGVFFAVLLQPMYVLTHVRKLEGLIT